MVKQFKLNTGDLLVWGKSSSNSSKINYLKLVRFFTASNYGHVSVLIKKNGQLYHVEAVSPKIQLVPLLPTEDLYIIPMGFGKRSTDVEEFFKDKIGLKYSFLDAIRAWLGITLKNDNRWQCAELCLELYRHLGLDIPNAFTPSELVKTIMKVLNKPLLPISIAEGVFKK